ncbi:hypothetical protein PWT90_09887 [Aphanocladium album]|nr:hypothetical protein PWT90_09887 [Aphanocladium album]
MHCCTRNATATRRSPVALSGLSSSHCANAALFWCVITVDSRLALSVNGRSVTRCKAAGVPLLSLSLVSSRVFLRVVARALVHADAATLSVQYFGFPGPAFETSHHQGPSVRINKNHGPSL